MCGDDPRRLSNEELRAMFGEALRGLREQIWRMLGVARGWERRGVTVPVQQTDLGRVSIDTEWQGVAFGGMFFALDDVEEAVRSLDAERAGEPDFGRGK
jgi:hypothetical protein